MGIQTIPIIKKICEQWRDNKCIHCGAQMKYDDDNLKCPNCVWNDSQERNSHMALLDIGKMVGSIFFMTGASVA